MSIDDRIRSAFEELAPAVSSDGVLASLEERLATPPPPPRPPRSWRRWLGGAAGCVLVVAVIALAIAGGADGGDERAQARSDTTSSTQPDRSTTSALPLRSTTSTAPVEPGPVLAPAPSAAPVPPTPAVPVVRDDGPGSSFPSVPWASIPAGSDPSPSSTTTTTTAPSTTTTSLPTDPPPLVVDGALSEVEVWELEAAACARPATITVSVRVLDDQPVASVEAVPGILGGKRLALAPVGGDRFEGTLGPWPVGTVPFGLSLPVSVTVVATDTAGQVGELVVGAFRIRSASTC
jgi:hypothetical protein